LFRFRELDYDIWNFVGFDGKQALGRSTIIAENQCAALQISK